MLAHGFTHIPAILYDNFFKIWTRAISIETEASKRTDQKIETGPDDLFHLNACVSVNGYVISFSVERTVPARCTDIILQVIRIVVIV